MSDANFSGDEDTILASLREEQFDGQIQEDLNGVINSSGVDANSFQQPQNQAKVGGQTALQKLGQDHMKLT